MNKIKLIIMAILVTVFVAVVYIKNADNTKKNTINSDAIKFKEEYEKLNENDVTQKYQKISISENNPIIYASYKQIEKIITEGTGIIYFGFPECPWCRNAVPVLLDAANETGVNEIYYFNAYSMRDVKHLDENGSIVIDKEGTVDYYKIVELLYNYLGEYEGLNDPSIKRLYFPTIAFIKEGKIIGVHVGTVDSQESAKNPLDDKQYNELKEIYSNYMFEVLGTMCTNVEESKC